MGATVDGRWRLAGVVVANRLVMVVVVMVGVVRWVFAVGVRNMVHENELVMRDFEERHTVLSENSHISGHVLPQKLEVHSPISILSNYVRFQ